MSKWDDLSTLMRTRRLGVLAVQETHLRQGDLDRLNERMKRKIFIIHSRNPTRPNANGVAIILNRQSTAWAETRRWALIPGQALMVQFPWKNTRQHRTILAVYAPNNPRENEAFWRELATKWDGRSPPPKPDIVLGDMNIVEDSIDRIPIHGDDPQAVAALRALKHRLGLVDGWRKENPEEIGYTYLQNTMMSQSRIDRIYTTRQIARTTPEWLVEPSNIATDHNLVSFHYYDPGQQVQGFGRATLPLWVANDEKFLKLGRIAVKDATEGVRLYAQTGPDEDQVHEIQYPVQKIYNKLKIDLWCIAKVRIADAMPKIKQRMEARRKDLKAVVNDRSLHEEERKERAAEIETELRSMHLRHHSSSKDKTHLRYSAESEVIGKRWISTSKDPDTRDPIMALQKPPTETEPNPGLEYNSKRMAEIARQHHDRLQRKDLYQPGTPEEGQRLTQEVLGSIKKRLLDNQVVMLGQKLTREVHTAMMGVPNEKAPGVDGFPIEIWKNPSASPKHPEEWGKSDDSSEVLTAVFNEIEENGLWEEHKLLTRGWMCPLYEKKDKTDIANYRPITVFNTDYKIFAKALANKVSEVAPSIIHEDQAGFMKDRRIEDHTDLMKVMIEYCSSEGANGALVLLDQEKAYDKITHDFLDKSLEKFGFTSRFQNTVKSLYKGALTQVMINGHLSTDFIVTRGVRQGDPLSCLLFNLAIEPLASLIRNSNIQGIRLPKSHDRVVTTLFADNTTIYLDETDDFAELQAILDKWCRASGAKFNVAKTEVIPLGNEAYRTTLIHTRKMNLEATAIPENICIAKDGEAISALGAFIGNNIGEASVWTPTIEATEEALNRWARVYPTLEGKCLVVGMEVGGRTQFRTRVQGMPPEVELCFEKMITRFLWNGRQPTVKAETLRLPHEEGGFNVLDIKARNEAIDLMKLKRYLTFESRPRWTQLVDHMLTRNIPKSHRVLDPDTTVNMLTQTWAAAKQTGKSEAPAPVRKMLKTAQKYGVQVDPHDPTEQLKDGMPLWHHIGWDSENRRRDNSRKARCLRTIHEVHTVGNATEFSQRTHDGTEPRSETPESNWDSSTDSGKCSEADNEMCCKMCEIEERKGCKIVKRCQKECQKIITCLRPLWQPAAQDDTDEVEQSTLPVAAQHQQHAYDRKRSKTQSEMFRIFTNDTPNPTYAAPRQKRTRRTGRKTTVYTDGSCTNPGYGEGKAGAGIWYGHQDERNQAVRVPETLPQTNNAAEAMAVLVAIQSTPSSDDLTIKTDSQFVIDALTTGREKAENTDWLLQANREILEPTIARIRKRKGKTTLVKVKGHSGIEGNEEADKLAAEGADKDPTGNINLKIPRNGLVKGALLSSLTQHLLYKGIRRIKAAKTTSRRRTTIGLDIARYTAKEHGGLTPNDATIWKSTRNHAIANNCQKEFLWKLTHGTLKCGSFWDGKSGYENRVNCPTCGVVETAEHTLTECQSSGQAVVWRLVLRLESY